MPVDVTLPVHIRLDPAALLEQPAWVDSAVEGAIGRALRNSVQEVLDKRGGYVGVRIHPPELSWYGPALAQIPAALRHTFEQRLTEKLHQAIEATGVLALARQSEELALPLSGEQIAEISDDARFSNLLGLYQLPGYKGGGAPASVEVMEFNNDTLNLKQTYTWEVFEFLEDVMQAFAEALWAKGRKWPISGFLGVVFEFKGKGKRLAVYEFPSKEAVIDIPLPPLFRIQVKGSGAKAELVREPVVLEATSSYELEWYGAGTTEAECADIIANFLNANFHQLLYNEARKHRLSQSEIETQIATKFRKMGKILAGQLPSFNVTFVTIMIDGNRYLFDVPKTLPVGFKTELIPLSEWKAAKAKKAGMSEGSGAGRAAGEGGKNGGKGSGEGQPGQLSDKGAAYTGNPDDQNETGRIFPGWEKGGDKLVCQPFLGEPKVSDLGAAGQQMQALIKQIADKLQIESCEYAANFCLNAGLAIRSHAEMIGRYAERHVGFALPPQGGAANLRVFEFVPTASPSIQLLRRLASAVPLISQLERLIDAVYPATGQLQGEWAKNPTKWQLRFHIEQTAQMEIAVSYVFGISCQMLLLQLLDASRTEILRRTNNFEGYAPTFEALVRYQLTDLADLYQLRDRLQPFDYETRLNNTLHSRGEPNQQVGWAEAITGSVRSVKNLGKTLYGEGPEAIFMVQGAAPLGDWLHVRVKDNVARVKDKHEKWWSMPELEAAIALRRGTAESQDPLVKQLTDIPEVAERLKQNPKELRRELRHLLTEMLEANGEITQKVEGDWIYAVEASKISENIPKASVAGLNYPLQGIHLEVHKQVGEFFEQDGYYALGINALFGARVGRSGLQGFFIFTGLVLVAVICPHLVAFAAGVAVAGYEYDKASEKEDLYQSLINPEQVISWAEVEAELFAAELGLVLAFIPEAPAAIRGAISGGKAIAQSGVHQGVKLIGSRISAQITKELIENLSRELIAVLAKEMVTAAVLNFIISDILGGILKTIEREAIVTGAIGGADGIEAVLQMLQEEAKPPEPTK